MYGLSIARRDLDTALVHEAARAGARVEEGVLVRGPLVDSHHDLTRVRGVVIAGRDGRDIRVPAPLVIAADGRRSRIAVALGLARHPQWPRRWAIGAYFEGVRDLGPAGRNARARPSLRRHRPLALGGANVCVVTSDRTGLDQPAEVLRRAVDGDWHLADRFRTASLVSRPVVLGRSPSMPSTATFLACSSRATRPGSSIPLLATACGLRFAGPSSPPPSRSVPLERRADDPQATLARLRRKAFAAKWRFNRTVRRLVATPSAIHAAGLAASVSPTLFRHVIAFAGDVRHV